MKKFVSVLCLIIAAILFLSACGGKTTDKKSTSSSVTATDPEPLPEETEIVISYNGNKEEGFGSAEMKVSSRYKSGERIEITLPEGQHYLAVTIAKDVLEETIVFLKNSKFSYTIPEFSGSYPPELQKSGCVISARVPSKDELIEERNIALNPCDLLNAQTVFPHAASNNVYQNNNSPEWLARNAIDGFRQNTGHGTYPLQSWGPDSTVKSGDFFRIDFGREVNINRIVLYIRADFPHDAFWDSCVVELSDGSVFDITGIKETQKKQTFKFDELTTTSLKFTNLHKSASSSGDWAAWTEVEVYGYENFS